MLIIIYDIKCLNALLIFFLFYENEIYPSTIIEERATTWNWWNNFNLVNSGMWKKKASLFIIDGGTIMQYLPPKKLDNNRTRLLGKYPYHVPLYCRLQNIWNQNMCPSSTLIFTAFEMVQKNSGQLATLRIIHELQHVPGLFSKVYFLFTIIFILYLNLVRS